MAAPTPSKLDQQQVLQGSYDESTGRIRVDAELTSTIIPPPGLEVAIHSIDDNIAIRNTNNNDELLINHDGSIDVNILASTTHSVKSLFNSISSVSSGNLTTILSYTVPFGITDYLSKIEASGDNIATFEVSINGVLNARQRTYFGADLNTHFSYSVDTLLGYTLNSGDIVTVNVIHDRPDLGNFEARIVYAE